jgi:hypothetical protein
MSCFSHYEELGYAPEAIRFRVNQVPLFIVNGLRRTIIEAIPTAGFMYDYTAYQGSGKPNGVDILENSSVLSMETLGNRISLTPLYLDPSLIDSLAKGQEKVKLVLEKENDTDRPMDVSTHDMVYVKDDEFSKGNFPDVDSLVPEFLVTKLPPGGKIKVALCPSVSTGRVHARNVPVSICTMERVYREVEEKEVGLRKEEVRNCFWFYVESEMYDPNLKVGLKANYLVEKGLEVLKEQFQSMVHQNPLSLTKKTSRGRKYYDLKHNGKLTGTQLIILQELLCFNSKFSYAQIKQESMDEFIRLMTSTELRDDEILTAIQESIVEFIKVLDFLLRSFTTVKFNKYKDGDPIPGGDKVYGVIPKTLL